MGNELFLSRSQNHFINLNYRIRRKKRSTFKKILWILFLLLITYFILNRFANISHSSSQLISPLVPTPSLIQHIPNPKYSKGLEEIVQKSLQGSKGTYAVVIKNLISDEQYYLLEDRIFEAGSLYKLWTMAETYQQIQKGEFDENEILSEKITT